MTSFYYDSRWQYTYFTVVNLYFIVRQVEFLAKGGNLIIGLFSIFFFGGFLVLGVWHFFDRRPRLQISEAGILDRKLGVGLIAWSDILDAYSKRSLGTDFICLRLRNESAYANRMSPLKRRLMARNRSRGFTPVFFPLNGVKINSEQLLEYILKESATARPTHPDHPTQLTLNN